MRNFTLFASRRMKHKFSKGRKNREEIKGVIIDIEFYLFESRSFREGKDRVGGSRSTLDIVSLLLLPRNLKGFPSGIDDTRGGEGREFVNFYRAIETFALSRHSNSCGNLSLNIDGGPCLLFSSFFSSFKCIYPENKMIY